MKAAYEISNDVFPKPREESEPRRKPPVFSPVKNEDTVSKVTKPPDTIEKIEPAKARALADNKIVKAMHKGLDAVTKADEE